MFISNLSSLHFEDETVLPGVYSPPDRAHVVSFSASGEARASRGAASVYVIWRCLQVSVVGGAVASGCRSRDKDDTEMRGAPASLPCLASKHIQIRPFRVMHPKLASALPSLAEEAGKPERHTGQTGQPREPLILGVNPCRAIFAYRKHEVPTRVKQKWKKMRKVELARG